MGEGPLVSVVIPAFNSSATIVRALDSVVAQTYRPIEIVVVDDNSRDDTVEVVQTYAARFPVTLVKRPQQGGASAARNTGIEAAKGDLVAFLDSDDEWLPTKLAKQVALITRNKAMTFVSCASELISQSGADLGDVYRGHRPTTGANAWLELLATNFVATPTVLVWRRHLVELAGFDPTLKIGEDQDMWIRLALMGELGYVPECLVRVNMRGDSLSSGAVHDQISHTLPMIERHVRAVEDRITASQRRRIMGARLGRLGRSAYHNAELRTAGLRMMLRAIFLGYEPVGSLRYILAAAPPTLWLKRFVRNVGS